MPHALSCLTVKGALAIRRIFSLVDMITVNVLKFRTLKNNYFPAVRNFRNYVSEKVLVFVILECGLYHEQKRYICM